ncbi:uncharacterized protein AMSG_10524 [Thecamonas trahens ATCC 50062]|uniref:PX domain-containing protein n=1 Tax=Thecamonas trahens ATCC 50062 TaxID=461836 RepID=A0A0L0DRF5_THETB|nr:hypothetical protein AMSG_10524 [Thecamonas trahens ATCC 50062]KNC54870.1 hypothetical protein AMSG_10524 [Thecamonas trahens ATCC 50062]|eukprot:XP_013753466.1 hypothetical protein AMSG_10524 [Thecamonas trahens ATCC 50062]
MKPGVSVSAAVSSYRVFQPGEVVDLPRVAVAKAHARFALAVSAATLLAPLIDHVVWRRFSEFQALASTLRSVAASAGGGLALHIDDCLLALPKKTFRHPLRLFGLFDEDHLSKRAHALDAFVAALLSHRSVIALTPVADFLCLPHHMADPADPPPPASSPLAPPATTNLGSNLDVSSQSDVASAPDSSAASAALAPDLPPVSPSALEAAYGSVPPPALHRRLVADVSFAPPLASPTTSRTLADILGSPAASS